MIDELTYAREILKRGGYTLVICSGGRAQVSEESGIKPLLELVEFGESWKDAHAADKVVGKAAALLYVCLGVKAVFAETLSKNAAAVFDKYRIEYEYEALAENIINRSATGPCPMEEAVAVIDSPLDAVSALRRKINALSDN